MSGPIGIEQLLFLIEKRMCGRCIGLLREGQPFKDFLDYQHNDADLTVLWNLVFMGRLHDWIARYAP